MTEQNNKEIENKLEELLPFLDPVGMPEEELVFFQIDYFQTLFNAYAPAGHLAQEELDTGEYAIMDFSFPNGGKLTFNVYLDLKETLERGDITVTETAIVLEGNNNKIEIEILSSNGKFVTGTQKVTILDQLGKSYVVTSDTCLSKTLREGEFKSPEEMATAYKQVIFDNNLPDIPGLKIRKERVFQAATYFKDKLGKTPTVATLHEYFGRGSLRSLNDNMKEWSKENNNAPIRVTKKVIEEDVIAKIKELIASDSDIGVRALCEAVGTQNHKKISKIFKAYLEENGLLHDSTTRRVMRSV